MGAHLGVQKTLDRVRARFSWPESGTNLIEHRIITERGKKVKLRPYRIPEARRNIIKEEVEKMLRAG